MLPSLKWFEGEELDGLPLSENNDIAKRAIYKIGGFLLIVLLLAAGWYGYSRYFNKKKRRIIREFAISLPLQYKIHGIDISKHQGEIDWDSVKAMHPKGIRLKFVFVKATEGSLMTDKRFNENWAALRQRRLARGAYHFFRTNENAHLQAANFTKKVSLQNGDLPPVLDVEVRGTVSKAKFEERVTVWLADVEQFYGIKPIVYTNKDFYNQYLSKICKNHPVWIAHYYENDLSLSRKWLFWQHSDKGTVNGIDERVDFNAFSGDSTAFAKILYKKPPPGITNTEKTLKKPEKVAPKHTPVKKEKKPKRN